MMRNLFVGEVSRRRYLATGLALFVVKYALDYLITAAVFHRSSKWFPYFDPLGEIRGLSRLAAPARNYAVAMLL
jgi:hypothetical protein